MQYQADWRSNLRWTAIAGGVGGALGGSVALARGAPSSSVYLIRGVWQAAALSLGYFAAREVVRRSIGITDWRQQWVQVNVVSGVLAMTGSAMLRRVPNGKAVVVSAGWGAFLSLTGSAAFLLLARAKRAPASESDAWSLRDWLPDTSDIWVPWTKLEPEQVDELRELGALKQRPKKKD